MAASQYEMLINRLENLQFAEPCGLRPPLFRPSPSVPPLRNELIREVAEVVQQRSETVIASVVADLTEKAGAAMTTWQYEQACRIDVMRDQLDHCTESFARLRHENAELRTNLESVIRHVQMLHWTSVAGAQWAQSPLVQRQPASPARPQPYSSLLTAPLGHCRQAPSSRASVRHRESMAQTLAPMLEEDLENSLLEGDETDQTDADLAGRGDAETHEQEVHNVEEQNEELEEILAEMDEA